MPASSTQARAIPVGVKHIKTADLYPNPHNPRALFDRLPLEELKESIRRMGVLVPLTVYWERARDRYVILDGQRRWICCQDLGLKTVPVNQFKTSLRCFRSTNCVRIGS